LGQTEFLEVFALERSGVAPNVDGLVLDLLDAAAGPDRLAVHAIAGLFLVGVRPLGVDWIGECGARAGEVRCQGEGGPNRQDGCCGSAVGPVAALLKRTNGKVGNRSILLGETAVASPAGQVLRSRPAGHHRRAQANLLARAAFRSDYDTTST
jgi:hypothetical protein